MRILQVHNHHASKGGAMEVLAHEGVLLRDGGHHVSMFTLPAAQEIGLTSVRAGAKAIWNEEATRTLKELIGSFRPDVVHVHTPFPLLSPAVFRAAHGLGVPTVGTLHSYRYSCIAGTCHRDGKICEDCVGKRLKLPGLRHRCYHNSLGASAALTASLALHRRLGTFHEAVDRFIALTGFSKQLLIRDGMPASKVVVKPNSVSDPGPNQRELDSYVAFAGRLIDVKGIRTLLDAWERSVHPGVRLRIAGDGDLRGLVEQRAREDESIEYVGWLPESDICDFMGRAEAVIVPSQWYEGLPLVILRSLSVGTPVIAADIENFCDDILADDAGYAFRVGDAQSLADVLTTVIRHPQDLRDKRQRARESYLARYTPQADLQRLEAIYGSVISENRQRV